jgi:hypothetical protein
VHDGDDVGELCLERRVKVGRGVHRGEAVAVGQLGEDADVAAVFELDACKSVRSVTGGAAVYARVAMVVKRCWMHAELLYKYAHGSGWRVTVQIDKLRSRRVHSDSLASAVSLHGDYMEPSLARGDSVTSPEISQVFGAPRLAHSRAPRLAPRLAPGLDQIRAATTTSPCSSHANPLTRSPCTRSVPSSSTTVTAARLI